MKIVRSQFWITPEQKKTVRKIARKLKVSDSQVIRDVLNAAFDLKA